MEKKKCFVLTPIGEDNSDIREHVDAVIEQMIKPVMKITTCLQRIISVIRELLQSKLCKRLRKAIL